MLVDHHDADTKIEYADAERTLDVAHGAVRVGKMKSARDVALGCGAPEHQNG